MHQIPNLLTGIRILLTPVIVYALMQGQCGRALAITALAGVSDAADGYLARRMGAETRAGAYLDPVADKLLLTSLYLSFGIAGLAPSWLVGLVVGRDALILLMAAVGWMFMAIRDFPPSVWGKVSTVIQIGAAIVFLTGCALPLGQPLHDAAIWLTTAATAWSGLHYTWTAAQVAVRPAR